MRLGDLVAMKITHHKQFICQVVLIEVLMIIPTRSQSVIKHAIVYIYMCVCVCVTH